MIRAIWLTCGLAAMGLGFAGLALPILPTVPFLLLAAFCFARSSARLHDWLLEHRHFGPPIRAWNENGAIPRRIKGIASVSVLAGVGISAALGLPNWVLITQSFVFLGVTLFLWTRPDA